MKNIILSIVIALLLSSGIWYLVKNNPDATGYYMDEIEFKMWMAQNQPNLEKWNDRKKEIIQGFIKEDPDQTTVMKRIDKQFLPQIGDLVIGYNKEGKNYTKEQEGNIQWN